MEPTEDSNNYKYGVFYYNKDDSRIIVPKRIKYMGWTVNFAHPLSYLIMGGILAMVIVAWIVAPQK
ncbi:hypothetical protein DIU31_026145 [Mucilaginibacter rubeus]|uniref:DUF5808 domain-containing protein n=1 Tax=Mucilaginibacter rubeus TaxID=2027860 RepID=A0AAE6MKK2_9SPHI|nr:MULTISPECIES: DUF5808 domain-containing protein [Mucilaginibacter]QEM06815.1 hypothetical protein DIU31_026145 [Mucilaginibacter rubeus]QEM19402.1 hypothetical protein DIU38_026430 [Mucilaginibacter gossypii]QTE44048.1 hypothetical protein J3L19_01295 [Mucilaginibacter rubeus]QTE50649.1 hypothetical protein J3L21_01275 [Mucilaginibacter rubeus]QTE55733.1 hypothetical protein J3L23_26510 [Mucilaginibacter rubeus]